MNEPLIEFDLPVYFTREFKRKKAQTHLVGMNWYRDAHFAIQNLVKQHYHQLMRDMLSDKVPSEPLNSYRVEYTYFYKSVVSDMPNVCSIMSKFANDSFQELGFVIDDNVQYLKHESFFVGGRDSANPRVHVALYSA